MGIQIERINFVNHALFEACKSGDVLTVRSAMEAGTSANSFDDRKWTGLMYAADNGYVEVCSLLIDFGARVNHFSSEGYTPLMRCALGCGGNLIDSGFAVATLLLENGAEVDAADKNGFTALMIGAYVHWSELVTELLKRGANPDLTNANGDDAEKIAKSRGAQSIAETIEKWDRTKHITSNESNGGHTQSQG